MTSPHASAGNPRSPFKGTLVRAETLIDPASELPARIERLSTPVVFDIALRDFGVALGAFALAQLSSDFSE
jgi:hypothetical protein